VAQQGIVDSDAGVSVQATEDFGSCWKDPDILFVPGNSIHLFKQLQDDRTIDFIADVVAAPSGSPACATVLSCWAQRGC